jgi:DNA sulfur modification protein DndE
MISTTLETIRLDQDTKTRLATLKRRTGIENWNSLCRWAFCLSLSDPNPPRELNEKGIGAVEMAWKTFAGDEEEIYGALLLARARLDRGAVDREALSVTARHHISRGTARLVAKRDLKSIKDLVSVALAESE